MTVQTRHGFTIVAILLLCVEQRRQACLRLPITPDESRFEAAELRFRAVGGPPRYPLRSTQIEAMIQVHGFLLASAAQT